MLIAPGVAVAADFRVTTTADGDDKECADDCTLREAVVLAGSADRVVVPSGNYVLTMGELFLVADEIVGQGARTTFIGANETRVLRLADGTSSVSGVTIRNGNGASTVSPGIGGGIFVQQGATLAMQNSEVRNNTATNGGGIFAAGVAQLIGVTVAGNVATAGRLARGGGLASATTGGLFLGNATVSGNSAQNGASEGGGIFSSGTLAIIATTIASNSAVDGGGLYFVPPATGASTLMQNSVVAHGTSGGACGGEMGALTTVTANVASDATCQLKDPSNLNNVDPRLGTLANNGGPTDTHALLAGSPAIGRASSCAATDQRTVARIAPCDSGAYEYAGTLRVVTAVTNDDGGTLAPASFNVHVRRAAAEVTGSPAAGSAAGTTYTLDAATYAVEADGQAGYALSYSADCNAALAGGQTRTCTITANDIAPTLRVVTNVINDNGGTRTASGFNLHVRTGGVDVSGSPQAGSTTGTTYTLDAGPTYAVAADAVTGYTFTTSGSCSSVLSIGQSALCTVTANDVAPTLRVITNVVNDEGGTLTPASFTARVRTGGVDVAGSPQAGSATGTTYTVSAGPTYTVSADAVTGYALTVTGTCAANGTIALTVGQNATCTIMATDTAPTIRLRTAVVNDSGGTLAPGNFSAHVRSGANDVNGSPQTGAVNGTLYTVPAGSYTVALDAVAGYAFTVSGDCAANGSITLALAQNRDCTITANDVAPTLRVVTSVVNDNGGTLLPAGVDVHVRRGGTDVPGSPQDGTGAPGAAYNVIAGAHVVAADAVSGYTITYGGACAANGSITLALAQTASCTVALNDVAPTLTVLTSVINDNGGTRQASGFSVHVRQGATDVPTSPQNGSTTGTAYTLTGGTTYTVAADNPGGYTFTVTGACAANGNVTMQVGVTPSCTVTANDVAPTLNIVTAVDNGDGGTRAASSFSVHVRTGGTDVSGSPKTGNASYTLSAGPTYTVTPAAAAGYTFSTTGTCTGALTVGQNATCTVTANDIAPTLRVITNVVNNDGGTLTAAQATVRVRRNGTVVASAPGSTTGTVHTLAVGAHVVASDAIDGYAASYTGDCAANGSVPLALADAKTCTVTLDDGASTVNVATTVVNDDGGTAAPADFAVSLRLAGVEIASQPGGGAFAVSGNNTYGVAAGGVPGYAFAYGGDCGGDGSVAVGLSQTRNCTVTANDVAPTLTVVTNVVNDHGGSAGPASFSVHVRTGGADVAGSPQPGNAGGTAYSLDAGVAYAVAADPLAGYASDGCSMTLSPGQNATCTITANDDAPPQGTEQLPPPVVGKNVNALPASGQVQYKLPGASRYVQLAEGEQIPVGTVIDVLKGRVTLVASDGKGGTATADFYGGVFKLGQTKAGLTVLTLVEKLTCPKTGKKATASAKKKKKRRLWGDGSGNFQTKGKHSAATVVGTKWLVEDTCTTTLTRVDRGRVSVRDFVKKKTVLVKAGKKYIARAKKKR